MRHRETYRQLINSPRWRATRAAVLSANPFCKDCATVGVLTPAAEVHHIVPVESSADYARMVRRMFDLSNLVGLCHECHRERHRSLGKNTKAETLKRARAEADEFNRNFYGDPGGEFLRDGEGV